VPGPDGVAWCPTTINGTARGTGIINNEFYIGRLVWTARALFTGGVFFAFISLTGTQAVPSQRNSWCS
jgi:hypothetical protein